MTKYGRWEPISSSSGSDSDCKNDEELRGTKKEIEDKVKKVLNLIEINDWNGKDSNSEENLKIQSEVVELIEDFHRQYKSLYALYDHLKGELRHNVDNIEEKEISFSSTSSSDSEYYSPEAVSGKSSNWGEPQKVVESIKLELENASSEVTDLKCKLNFMTENEGLQLEYNEAMTRNQELKKMISNLEIEAEHRQNIIQAVKDESAQLKEKLGERERYLLSSAEMHKIRENEVSVRTKELEDQIAALKLEQNILRTKKREMEQQIESKTIEIKHLGEENSKLHAQILAVEKISKGKGQEFSAVVKKFKDSKAKVNDLVAQVNSLQIEVDSLLTQKGKLEEELVCQRNEAAQINSLQIEVDSLNTQKGKLEEELVCQRSEASDKVKGLMEQAVRERLLKDDQIEKLQDKILELDKTLKERGEESFALQRKFENGHDEASSRFMSLTAQFNKLEEEYESLQTEKNQLELQISREKQEAQESLVQAEKRNSELTSMIAGQQRTLKEQEDTINQLIKECEQVNGHMQESKSKLQTSERKMEELSEEFCKNIEDNIRLLSQRIQVAEALHAENKENYRMTKGKFEQEHKMLLLRETNLKSSEVNANKEVEEKSSLMKAVSQLEKKVTELELLVKVKEEGMQELGEEKREAIRQLCMLIDYHRSCNDHLKELISKLTGRSR